MQPSTIGALQELEAADWFSHVGRKDTTVAILLSSWEDAVASCASPDWEDLRHDALNHLGIRVLERSKSEYVKWNDIVREIKKTAIPLVLRKIQPVVCEHHLPKIFEVSVITDITRLCIEAEYAHVCPPGFFAGIAYFYVTGHFPCGWSGQHPEGKLVIY